MHHQQEPNSPLEKAVGGFAFTASVMATLFLIPMVIRLCHEGVTQYLSHDIDRELAVWGAWVFVGCAVFCVFFALNIILQFGIRLLFRSSGRGGF